MGGFLRLSKCVHGVVKAVVIPQGCGGEGWMLFNDNIVNFVEAKGVGRMSDGVGGMLRSPGPRPRFPTYKEALQSSSSVDMVVKESGESGDSNDGSNWSWIVVCERQAVHQPWGVIQRHINSCFNIDIQLFPYQCNRAFFNCSNKEHAAEVGGVRKLSIPGHPEVLLHTWEQGLKNNVTKVVSYGGWIAIAGLPMHWWSKPYFQRIGDACGGLIEVAHNTANFRYLFEAKIKVRRNTLGFLPELLKLSEGNETYYVQIRPVSAAIRPKINSRYRRSNSMSMDRVSRKKVWKKGDDTPPKEDETGAGMKPHSQVVGLEEAQGKRTREARFSGSVKEGLERTEETGTFIAPNDGDKTSMGIIGPHTMWAGLSKSDIGPKLMKSSSVDARAWGSENKPEAGPCDLDNARVKLKECGPACSMPMHSTASLRARFKTKFGRGNGDGGRRSRVGEAFSEFVSSRTLAGVDCGTLHPRSGRTGVASDDSISSIYPDSLESAEAFPRSDSEFVDDVSSCEDTLKAPTFEGEEGVLNSFFAPVEESIVVSDSDHEDGASSTPAVEPKLLQYKRRKGRANKQRLAGMPESKKFLSMMDISVVPIKRNLLNGNRGKLGKSGSCDDTKKIIGVGDRIQNKGASRSF